MPELVKKAVVQKNNIYSSFVLEKVTLSILSKLKPFDTDIRYKPAFRN